MENNDLIVRGGVRLDFMNYTYPFAKLKIHRNNISLKVFISGSYSFSPEQIIKFEKIVFFPLLAWGIRIHHSIHNYPTKIIFWCMGNPQKLLDKIAHIGFTPKA